MHDVLAFVLGAVTAHSQRGQLAQALKTAAAGADADVKASALHALRNEALVEVLVQGYAVALVGVTLPLLETALLVGGREAEGAPGSGATQAPDSAEAVRQTALAALLHRMDASVLGILFAAARQAMAAQLDDDAAWSAAAGQAPPLLTAGEVAGTLGAVRVRLEFPGAALDSGPLGSQRATAGTPVAILSAFAPPDAHGAAWVRAAADNSGEEVDAEGSGGGGGGGTAAAAALDLVLDAAGTPDVHAAFLAGVDAAHEQLALALVQFTVAHPAVVAAGEGDAGPAARLPLPFLVIGLRKAAKPVLSGEGAGALAKRIARNDALRWLLDGLAQQAAE